MLVIVGTAAWPDPTPWFELGEALVLALDVRDADQLAPVGAGKPFAELVASGLVETTRLTHIFRQAADSMIVQGAHAIRRGAVPEFAPGAGMRRDLFLIERGSARQALAEIVSLVAERLPTHYGVDPVRDIQVFAPVYRGEVGIDAINQALRAAGKAPAPGPAPATGGAPIPPGHDHAKGFKKHGHGGG